jgi:hypothetical protein
VAVHNFTISYHITINEYGARMKEIVKKLCLLLVLLLLSRTLIYAQSKFSISEGWGYYELTNIGARWNFSEKSSLWLYGGTNFGFNNKTLWSAGLTFDHTFPKPLFWKLKPGFSLGTLYWTSNDEFYYFTTLSFPAMVFLVYPISESFMVRAEGGGVLNAVLSSDRKQNVEAGYPSRANGNVRLSFIYNLGKK